MHRLTETDKKNFKSKLTKIKSTNQKIEILLFEYFKNYLNKKDKKTFDIKMLHKAFDPLHVSNDMWLLTNDKSTDYNFYTKRIILSTVIVKIYYKINFRNNIDEDSLKIIIRDEIINVGKINKLKSKIFSCSSNPLSNLEVKKNTRGY